MNTATKIQLTDAEKAAIRRVGGMAYMGLIDFPGTRYRGVRTEVFRTEELAEAAVNRPRYRALAIRKVVLIDVNGDIA